jgi:hypothetical protein
MPAEKAGAVRRRARIMSAPGAFRACDGIFQVAEAMADALKSDGLYTNY